MSLTNSADAWPPVTQSRNTYLHTRATATTQHDVRLSAPQAPFDGCVVTLR
ncbi:hypothetical protein [Xanthomonas melonis]|uniref:hypothetical protein n=1 Tax=Xanthomonas melonis TaxID=56456 RepID=UPI00142D932F|nr:hypothetical protein [Xanthomonas melonis]MCC4600604.1 hypothetical protein [Xanthomonas melonis]